MFTVALAALAVSAQILGSAQACSSVLSVAEANGLTLLLAGVESLEGQPQSGLFLTALRAGFPFPAQFTIYAPSDAAFEASFPGGLPAADVLGGVLVSHVSNNAESSADLAAQAAAAAPAAVSKTTVGSGSLALTTDATGALFIGLADSTGPPSKIVTPDLETCAGTLHVINRVMLPPELLPPAPAPAPPPAVLPAPLVAPVVAPLVAPVVAPAPVPVVAPVPVQVPAVAPVAPVAAARVPAAARALVPAPAPAPAEPPAVGPAPVQVQCEPFTDAITDAGLTRLQALVTAATDYPPAAVIMAALTSAERTAQQFTVFAPQDEALRAVLPGYTGPVKSTEVLSNHVVLGAWDAAALLADIQGAGPGGLALPTLGGARLLLTTDGLSIFILPEGSPAVTAPAVVEEADFLACGGVLHVIDSVLVEGSEPVDGPLAGLSTPNVVEVPEGFGEAPGPADVLAPAPAEVLEAQSGCGHQQRRLLVLACAAAAVFSVVLT